MKFLAVPTKRGLLFLLLTLSALGVAFMNSGLLTAFTASVLSALLVSSFLMTLFSLAGMSVKRSFPQEGHCGSDLFIEIAVENRFPLYRQECVVLEELPFLLSGQYAFALPALAPREKRKLSFRIKAEKRGEYRLEKVFLCSGDPLGLFRKKRCFFLPCAMEIHPRHFPLQSLAAVNTHGGMPNAEGRALGHAGKGPEFFGVRPYRAGDEVRHIHWKTTAAKGKLMVKEFEAAAVDEIVILLDTEKKRISPEPCDNNFEFLISCAYSIAEYLSGRYCHLQLIAADGKEGGLHQISGDAASVKRPIRQLLTLLGSSDMPFSGILSAAAESIPGGSIVYLFSMSRDPEPLAEMIGALEERDSRCFLLCAPGENFPPIEPDRPRIVRREKLSGPYDPSVCTPLIADFATKAEELLEGGGPNERI